MKRRLYFMTFAVAVLMILLSGCAAKDPLVGKWEFYDGVTINNYEFFADKTVMQDFGVEGYNDSWTRSEYTYELNDGNLILKNEKDIPENESTPYNVEGDILIIDNKYGFSRVEQFTNEYQSDGKTKPTSKLKSGYVFTAGQYSAITDIYQGMYDLQWVSGSGTCTVGDSHNKISGNFGEGTGDIKEYKNCEINVSTKIEVSGTLIIMFIPK